MSASRICQSRELDYFVLEAAPDEGGDITIDDLSAMSMECFFIFAKDGDLFMKMFSKTGVGQWDDETITLWQGDESASFDYSLDGDLLKLDFGGGEMVFKRSDDAPPDINATPEPDSGKRIETSFTDVNGKSSTMSAVCPNGWYSHITPMADNMISFSTSADPYDENASSIKITCYAKLLDTHSIKDEGMQISFALNDMTWEGVHDSGEATIKLLTIIDNSIVDIYGTRVNPDSDELQQVLNSFEFA